jgi:hypothetical protein
VTNPERYLYVETGVAAGIGAAFSLAFALAIFGGHPSVALLGARGMIRDAIPHGFMVALPSSLVSAMLARLRLRRGRVEPFPGRSRASRFQFHPVARSALLAIGVAVAGFAVQATMLPRLTAPTWPVATAVTFKVLYGALIAAAVAWISVRAELIRWRPLQVTA